MSGRYERERSKHLLKRAGRAKRRLRRAQILERRAAALERNESRSALASHHEVITPWFGARWVDRGDDHGDKLFAAMTVGAFLLLVFVTVGPALLLGLGLYKLFELLVPGRLGQLPFLAKRLDAWSKRLKPQPDRPQSWWAKRLAPWPARLKAWPAKLSSWPFWVAAGIAAGALIIELQVGALDIWSWATYWWLQVIIGLARAAWRVRAWGWTGVAIRGAMVLPAVALPQAPVAPTVPDPSVTQVPAAPRAPAAPSVIDVPAPAAPAAPPAPQPVASVAIDARPAPPAPPVPAPAAPPVPATLPAPLASPQVPAVRQSQGSEELAAPDDDVDPTEIVFDDEVTFSYDEEYRAEESQNFLIGGPV